MATATRPLPVGAQRAVATAQRRRSRERRAKVVRAAVSPARYVRVGKVTVSPVSAASYLLLGMGLLGLWYLLLVRAKVAGLPDLPVLPSAAMIAGIVVIVALARYFPRVAGYVTIAIVLGMALLAAGVGLLPSRELSLSGGTR